MRIALIAPLVLVVALSACGDSGTGASDGTSDAAAKEAAAQKKGPCKDVKAPAARKDGGQKKPKALPSGTTYDVTFATSCGDFTIQVDQKTSPKTAASFVSLAKAGYFDNTVFHRIVPGFVIQGGDPTGTGMGRGPGYSTRDVPPKNTKYTKGVVAMAKTGAEPPGTAGSQFYVVTGEDAGLPPEYAVLGKVTTGLKVTEAISQLGDPASGEQGTPTRPVVVESAKVSTGG